MKIYEIIDIIRFNTATVNELSNKNINTLFTDRNIITQLKLALHKFAVTTKAIEDIYSLPLPQNTEFIDIPPLALRTGSYYMIYVWLGNKKFMLSSPDLKVQNTNIPYQNIHGIPRWFVPWKDKAYINPNSNDSAKTTTLNGVINSTITTITLTDASNFLLFNGKITIDNEKISYKYRVNNILYECVRGDEFTTASSHLNLASVTENNLWIFYRRKHFEISDNKAEWDKESDIDDDHIEVITDYTTFKLLSKIDSNRAEVYKINFNEWLDKIKNEVKAGRTAISESGFIRNPFDWETDYPGYLL
jgi:hypothetical protein